MCRDIFILCPGEVLFSGLWPYRDGIVAYRSEIEEEMAVFCHENFSKFVSDTIVFQCTPEAQAIGRTKL